MAVEYPYYECAKCKQPCTIELSSFSRQRLSKCCQALTRVVFEPDPDDIPPQWRWSSFHGWFEKDANTLLPDSMADYVNRLEARLQVENA